MSLRGLHTFIFETAHYRRLRGGFMPLPLCRFRGVQSKSNSFSTSAWSQMQWQWQCRRLCEEEERVGKMVHMPDTARSWLAKRGNADVRREMLARGRERVRWRGFHSSALQLHEPIVRPAPGTGITIHFEDSKGQPLKTIEANNGDNILDLAHEYDIDLEGACEGSVACSTCHIILTPQHYDMLPEPEDDENDMLDMAFGLTDTSRLGCQVKVTPDLDGMVVKLPSATRNMFVDGVKPTKH